MQRHYERGAGKGILQVGMREGVKLQYRIFIFLCPMHILVRKERSAAQEAAKEEENPDKG